MMLLRRLALLVVQELARNPTGRAKAAEVLAKTRRALNDDLKPRAERTWRQARPVIHHARSKLQRVAEEVREEYRKGRGGQ